MAAYCSTDKLAVRDSLDDDDLSDVDDEVFIRDGKSGFKFVEERGVKRPLMAPRRKPCKENLRLRTPRLRCAVYCYVAIGLLVLLGLIVLTVLLVSLYPLPLDGLRTWYTSYSEKQLKLRPYKSLRVTGMWNITFPKLTIEAPIRAVDLNQDGIEDIIIGYGTENPPNSLPFYCAIYFEGQTPCLGGVIALDGRTGSSLWQQWTAHSVFSLDCSTDITGDNISDCVVMGRGGVLCAMSGQNGSIIWQFPTNQKNLSLDVYAGQVISDQDGDGVADILVSHTLQSEHSNRTGHLILISGKTGSEIRKISTPNDKEIYYAPQLITRTIKSSGNNSSEQVSVSNSIIFGTGGENTPGGLYALPLSGLLSGKSMRPTLLYQDKYKGILQPSVLVDITGDNVEDIIFCTFNSTVVALDGVSFKPLWNYTRDRSEVYSALTPGYFNDDNVTDFMVKFNIGKGYPTYFYGETVILDGRDGSPLLQNSIIDSAASAMAGLSLSLQGEGFDIFLYWLAQCVGYEDVTLVYEEFRFLSGSKVWEQSHADICKLRYNSSLVLKLYAMNQYDEPPGILIYSSENNTEMEFNNSVSALAEAKAFLDRHSNFAFDDNPMQSNSQSDELEEKIPQHRHNANGPGEIESSFRHKDDGAGLIKDTFSEYPHGSSLHKHIPGDEFPSNQPVWQEQVRPSMDYELQYGNAPLDPDNGDFYDETPDFRSGPILDSDIQQMSQNRDPRSKLKLAEGISSDQMQVSKKNDVDSKRFNKTRPSNLDIEKEIADEFKTLNEYKMIQNAQKRLLHDLSNVPSNILRESYLETAQKDLRNVLPDEADEFLDDDSFSKVQPERNSKFQQRDLRYKQNTGSSVKKELEDMYKEKRPESLWDLESEKEEYDRKHGYWRGKREMRNSVHGIPKVGGTGILLKSLQESSNSYTIDFVFAIYWLPAETKPQVVLPIDEKCVKKKLEEAKSQDSDFFNLDSTTLLDLFPKVCLKERGIEWKESPISKTGNVKLDESKYLEAISKLSLGQATIYRVQIQSVRGDLKEHEICSPFLSPEEQRWSEYLGKNGKGYFNIHN